MTTLQVTWDYDPEDDVTRTATSDRFFAAWVNQFGVIEWTAVPEDDPEWEPLARLAEETDR